MTILCFVFIGILETPKFVAKNVASLCAVITYKLHKKGTIGKPCLFCVSARISGEICDFHKYT